MNVIAQEGHWYLIDVGDGFGRVLDLEFRRYFPPQALPALLSKGSWEPFAGDAETVIASIRDAEDLAPETASDSQYVGSC